MPDNITESTVNEDQDSNKLTEASTTSMANLEPIQSNASSAQLLEEVIIDNCIVLF